MATIRIEYDYAASKAKTMEDNANKIEKLLNELVDDVQTNINSATWSGDSADAFRNVWQNSSGEFASYIQYMKAIQSKVHTAAEEAGYFDQN